MTFWMIIRNSLRQHALSTAVTALSIGLGCGLLMGVLVVSERAQQEFRNVTGGFDALVGPRLEGWRENKTYAKRLVRPRGSEGITHSSRRASASAGTTKLMGYILMNLPLC